MKFRICVLFLCLPFALWAKPVSIDEIFTPKKQFKILSSFSYLNVMRKNSSPTFISIPSSIHGIPNISDSVTIPFWNHENVNQDYLSFSLQARYGIAKFVEMFYQRTDLTHPGKILAILPTQENQSINAVFMQHTQDSKLTYESIKQRAAR